MTVTKLHVVGKGEQMQPKARLFEWPVRVYYEDTDAGGVVYYANYLRFFERARSEWLRSLGIELDALEREQQLLFVVRHIEADYLKPARFNDALIASIETIDIASARIRFSQCLVKTSEQEVLATAMIDVVCVDSVAFKAKRIPEHLTELMQKK